MTERVRGGARAAHSACRALLERKTQEGKKRREHATINVLEVS